MTLIFRLCLSCAAIAVAVTGTISHAQESSATGGAGSTGATSPTSVAGAPNGLSSICTDRPTRSNFACTVDAGHLQYETDLVNGSTFRLDGATTDTYLIINPTLKYGLTPAIDVEANLSPAEIVRTHTPGETRTIVGVSDLYLRLKYEVLNTAKGNFQASILPYVKAPTARPEIGDGAVEGGVIIPVNYKLTTAITLTIDPEVDLLENQVGGGRHVNTAQLINIGISLPKNVTLYGELWGDWNYDPTGTIRQYSADAAIAYGVTDYLQFDAGLNLGLNRVTPGVQAYVGVSQKF